MASPCDHADYSDDEFDFEEEYFSRTYRPLSNLPTPPPSSRNSLSPIEDPGLHVEGLEESALLGPAIHLVNLVPPAVSLATPSVSVVHEILTRAKVSMDTIALAVCILDTLSSKFALNWRLLCPLAPRADMASNHMKRHSIAINPSTPSGNGDWPSRQQQRPTQLHIDSVSPEIIILTALMLAVKFLEDCQEPTRYYSSVWGCDVWTCEQINVTERCVMESLGYRILPLWDQQLIDDALRDMERAGKQYARGPSPRNSAKAGGSCGACNREQPQGSTPGAVSVDDRHKRSVSSGVVLARGSLPTPVETPTSGTYDYGAALSPVDDDVRVAFGGAYGAHGPLTCDTLRLPGALRRDFDEADIADEVTGITGNNNNNSLGISTVSA